MKVFYHNDPDGRLSAFWVILAEWGVSMAGYKPGDRLIPMEYKTPFPMDEIQAGEKVYIVDYSIEPETMMALLLRTEGNVVWIDHHKSAIAKYKDFPVPIKGYRFDGYAACVLTCIYCYALENRPDIITDMRPEYLQDVPWFTKLIGDYDAWRWEFGDQTSDFYFGLLAENTDPCSDLWTKLLDEFTREERATLKLIQIKGRAIRQYRDRHAVEYADSWGYYTELLGHKAYAVNLARPSSLFFDQLNLPPEVDVMIGYVHDGTIFTVSIYSKTVDCAELASRLGGGGHRGAAGFQCVKLPFEKAAPAPAPVVNSEAA